MGVRDVSILAAGVRAATINSPDMNLGHEGHAVFTCDITSVPGVDTVTFTVQGKDPVSGKYVDLLASAAKSTTGTFQLEVGPGIAVAANASANRLLPAVFRVAVTHSGAGNFNYSVGASVKLNA